ncbi:MAG TPA: hypothetical protein VGH81_11830 [Rudaea sp.]
MNEPDKEPSAPSADRKLAERAQWGSLAALAISVLALAVGAYQTRLMQTQARASVWPYVVIGLDYAEKGERSGFDLHVQNNGVGPALVRSVQVRFDGKPIGHWPELFDALKLHGTVAAVLQGLRGIVIPPSTNRNTDVTAIAIAQPDAAKAVFESRTRLAIDICNCSIYDDCWVAHWLKSRPEPVAACHESAGEFDY